MVDRRRPFSHGKYRTFMDATRALHDSMPTKKCPVCGVSVKVENLVRHVQDQHPHTTLDREHLLSIDERMDVERERAFRRPVLSRNGRRLILGSTVMLGLVLVLFFANPFHGVGPSVGQTAPDFAVAASDGSSFRLSSLRGTAVLLEFMDTDCPACQHEAPILVSLYANYGSSVRFVSIDVNFIGPADTDAGINSFRSAYGATWLYALDSTHAITTAYAVDSTPTAFILDRAGVVVAVVHPPANTYAGYADHLKSVSS